MCRDCVCALRSLAPKVTSSTLTTFTEAAFFKRVSGDLDQVDGGVTRGRLTFGCLVNLDESYKFLRMLGLMHGKGSSKPGGEAARYVARARVSRVSVSAKVACRALDT